ncbi:MAG: putative toxin-antitoxin system toxin component, PIN family [Caldilineaceae bacterium]|nr:putative toxin-antitoxin system toxin component, PIN family [Caldilineaceae bacterium]
MLRVIIDTNVFIRYLIRPSFAVKNLIEAFWLTGVIQIVVAPELIEELTDVLQRKSIQRLVYADEGQALLDALMQQAEVLPAIGNTPVYTRDAKDDKFVACAIAGQADFLVTFDEDLLVLRQVGVTRVVTPQQLLAELTPP